MDSFNGRITMPRVLPLVILFFSFSIACASNGYCVVTERLPDDENVEAKKDYISTLKTEQCNNVSKSCYECLISDYSYAKYSSMCNPKKPGSDEMYCKYMEMCTSPTDTKCHPKLTKLKKWPTCKREMIVDKVVEHSHHVYCSLENDTCASTSGYSSSTGKFISLKGCLIECKNNLKYMKTKPSGKEQPKCKIDGSPTSSEGASNSSSPSGNSPGGNSSGSSTSKSNNNPKSGSGSSGLNSGNGLVTVTLSALCTVLIYHLIIY